MTWAWFFALAITVVLANWLSLGIAALVYAVRCDELSRHAMPERGERLRAVLWAAAVIAGGGFSLGWAMAK